MRVESVEGFVIHARDYRDSSQLVDIFTCDYGRVRLVARGSRSQKKNAARLSPFTTAKFSWTGRSELKTLTQFEPLRSLKLEAEHLICGFYLNELLWHLLQPEDSHPQLYEEYKRTLFAMAEKIQLEPLLRRFELNLLDEVGYGISFELDSTGQPVSEQLFYSLSAEQGWSIVDHTNREAISGQAILDILGGQFTDSTTQRLCKRINRQLIDHLLEGRKLHSRELISQMRG